HLAISTPQVADQGIESVTVGGVPCSLPPGIGSYECVLGTLAPGESRPIVVRGRGTSLGTYVIHTDVSGTGDQNAYNDNRTRGVTIKNAVDVAIASRPPTTLSEGLEGSGIAIASSNGSLAVANATFEVTAPSSFRFTRVYVAPTD